MRTWAMLAVALVGILMLAGCGLGKGETLNSKWIEPPRFSRTDPIKTVRAYQAEWEKSEDQIRRQSAELWGPARLVACARELATMKSAAGRAYARAVIQTLRDCGVAGSEKIVVLEGGDTVMTYVELARIDALTTWLVRGDPSPAAATRAAAGEKIPVKTWVAVVQTAALACPSDVGAGMATIAFNNSVPGDVAKAHEFSIVQIRDWMAPGYRTYFARLLDAKREQNLSTALALGSPLDPEIILYYVMSLDESSGQEVRDFSLRMLAAIKRAQKLDPTDEGLAARRKFYEDAEKQMDQKQEAWQRIAWKLDAQRGAAEVVDRFFEAVNREEDQAARQMVKDALPTGRLREALCGAGVRRVELVRLMITAYDIGTPGELSAVLRVTGQDGVSREKFAGVWVRKTRGEWQIDRVVAATE